MSEGKPTTVGEMITRLRNFDPNLPLRIISPEGLIMSGDLKAEIVFSRVSQGFVGVHSESWYRTHLYKKP